MSLPPLVGHHGARSRIATAVRFRRFPQLVLITGPAGVGKQRLALWAAQLMLCQAPCDEPCGRCRSCRQVEGLAHPDLHWFVPIPRPKAADPEKLVEETAEALAGVMTERREKPLYGPPDGMAGHFMGAARLILRRAGLTPVEGRVKVFVIGEAERLVPQEASQEAANALLKLFEEPPADSYFLLTTSEPEQVLPTIRSRAVSFRLGRLADEEIRRFLGGHLEGLSPKALDERVRMAEGSIGRALIEGGEAAVARREAEVFLEAVTGGMAVRMERALRQPPWEARGRFTDLLDAVAETLTDAVRAASGAEPRRPVPPRLLQRARPEALLEAIDRVAAAREAAQQNVNPQLLLASLGEELAAVL